MSQKERKWVEDSRKSRKSRSELGALEESLTNKKGPEQLEKGLVGGGLEGGQWRLEALSAAAMDLGSSYFAAGDRLSTQRSFTSPLETHFIDFSIFLPWLLSHPTTHFLRAPCLPGESPRGLPAHPSSTPGWRDGVKDLEVPSCTPR